MTLTLTPEQERRIKTLAQRKQKPVEAVLDELLPDVSKEIPERPRPDAAPEEIAAYIAARRAAQIEKNQPARELLAQWREEAAAMTEEEKERATEELNTLLASLQANRTRIRDEPQP